MHPEERTILILKMAKRRLALLLGLIVLPASLRAQIGLGPKKDFRLEAATDPKFRVGDVWEYDNRPGESSSRVTILKIDYSPEIGIIVHVAVDHLTWQDCQNNHVPQQVPHMPFARRSLEVSVKRRTASDQALPDYQEGYRQWREAYSNKNAGIYVIAVKDAVSVAEKGYRGLHGCK